MQQIDLVITAKEIRKPAIWELSLSGNELSAQFQPGRFYMLRCADSFSAYLRRPVFPYLNQPQTGESPVLQVILSAKDMTDAGLAWLVSQPKGAAINALGPLGHGFSLPKRTKNLLLVGSGRPVAPLLGLALNAASQKINVVLALEAINRAALYPVQSLPPSVEVKLATLNGSAGHTGSIIDHLGELGLWADTVCAAGSLAFYQRLKIWLQHQRITLPAGFAQVLLHRSPYFCGTGACTLCKIRTENGQKLACIDGPVFDLATLGNEVFSR